jgi:hypothetical protein
MREQWVEFSYYSCLASKFVSFGTETPKQAVSLFRDTTETNPFVSDSVETSFVGHSNKKMHFLK